MQTEVCKGRSSAFSQLGSLDSQLFSHLAVRHVLHHPPRPGRMSGSHLFAQSPDRATAKNNGLRQNLGHAWRKLESEKGTQASGQGKELMQVRNEKGGAGREGHVPDSILLNTLVAAPKLPIVASFLTEGSFHLSSCSAHKARTTLSHHPINPPAAP